MASVFISYAAPDRVLALRLAQDMTQFGHQVWLDLWQLGVGDSLVRGIGDGLLIRISAQTTTWTGIMTTRCSTVHGSRI